MAKGAGNLAAGRYAAAALGWAGSLVLVRVLSAKAWGEYSLIFGVIALIGTFADLQIGRVVLRELQHAGDGLEEMLGSYVTLRLSVGVACYGATIGVVWAGGYPNAVLIATVVAATVLILGSAVAGLWVYFSSQMWMRALGTGMVMAQVSQLGLTLILVAAGNRGLLLFVVPAVLFELVYVSLLMRSMRGSVRLRLRFDRSRWRCWLKEAGVLAIGSTLGAIYMGIDTVMLSKLADLPAVGVYAVGSKFGTLVQNVTTAVSAGLLVSMTKSWPDDTDGFVTAFRRALLLLFVAGVAVGIEFGAFSAQVIRLLYGQHFVVGSSAALGLVLASVLTYFSGLCFVALVAMGHNLAFVVATALGAVINVAINFVAIPRWSYNGASAATFITEALVLAILAGALRRRRKLAGWLPMRGIVKVSAAGVLMAAAAFLLRGHVPWELAAAVAAALYLVTLHFIRVDGPAGLRALAR